MKALRLNSSKCNLLSNTLTFSGQVCSNEGTRPDLRRVDDLVNALQPSDAHEVRSFLGIWRTAVVHIFQISRQKKMFATSGLKYIKMLLKSRRIRERYLHACPKFDKRKLKFVTVDAPLLGISAILSQQPKYRDIDHRQVLDCACQWSTEQRREKTFPNGKTGDCDSLLCEFGLPVSLHK